MKSECGSELSVSAQLVSLSLERSGTADGGRREAERSLRPGRAGLAVVERRDVDGYSQKQSWRDNRQ